MTTPEPTRSSRYESAVDVMTGIRIYLVLGRASALLIVLLLRRAIVHLHRRLRLQGAQRLVAPDDNLVSRFQTFCNLDVRDTGDARFNRPEHRLLAVHHEHTLHFVLFRVARRWRRGLRQRHARASLLRRPLRVLFHILARSHPPVLNPHRATVLPLP